MAVPTVRALSRRLGPSLAPAPGVDPPPAEISAVHVSELLDPTVYLSGGELLLTTGLSLPLHEASCRTYVQRLRRAGVSALALGLGPVHVELPALLARSCREAGVPLLLVPAPTPFLEITRAYWAEVARTTEEHLEGTLAQHRFLVDAAASDDAVPAVLQVLARALAGWAATLTPAGEVASVQPGTALRAAEETARDVGRLASGGVHSAASFAAAGSAVLVHPLVAGDDLAGFLAVGVDGPLEPAERQLVLSATGLLSLDLVRRSAAESAAVEAERCVCLLLTAGQAGAARELAALVGVPAPTEPLRVLLLRVREGGAAGPVAEVIRRWCPLALRRWLDPSTLQVLLPTATPAPARLRAELGDGVALALSAPTAGAHAALTSSALLADLDRLAPGEWRLAADDLTVGPSPADLVALPPAQLHALAGYLRHQGQWEAAARSLGVHRNTLRYRVRQAQERLGLDLADPDVAARTWLVLRAAGAA